LCSLPFGNDSVIIRHWLRRPFPHALPCNQIVEVFATGAVVYRLPTFRQRQCSLSCLRLYNFLLCNMCNMLPVPGHCLRRPIPHGGAIEHVVEVLLARAVVQCNRLPPAGQPVSVLRRSPSHRQAGAPVGPLSRRGCSYGCRCCSSTAPFPKKCRNIPGRHPILFHLLPNSPVG
jgi:hypothetical protein